MAAALTIKKSTKSHEGKKVLYAVALSGNYTQVGGGGEVLDLNAADNSEMHPNPTWGPEGPKIVKVVKAPLGHTAKAVAGADANHPLLQIFSDAATELAAGAYSGGVTGDTEIYVEAEG